MLQKARDMVNSDGFEMDWDALAMDKQLLGDWPKTIKAKDSKNPAWEVPPDERGTKVLIALANTLGRHGGSTRGLRGWLLDHRPPSSIA